LKLAFTICSNNYLAQAKTLGDSLLKYNPQYKFIIALVDHKSPRIDYSFFDPHEVILVEDIGMKDFSDVWRKYNLIELNTAVKPSVFKYLFKRFKQVSTAFYFDPDIMILNSLSELEGKFLSADVLLTPHIISPIELDALVPSENTFLNYGIFNLGFIGIKNNKEILEGFLEWWEMRTLNKGFIDICNGLFVDQLWINLAPIFFNNVLVLKEMGYNVAPWNLHERHLIEKRNGSFVMPDGTTLVFYHFSSYNYKFPGKIANKYDRFDFVNCPELKPIYEGYQFLLLRNKIDQFCNESCYYQIERQIYLKNLKLGMKGNWNHKWKFTNFMKAITPPVLWSAVKKIF
jgi:hypothetical protein